QASAELGGGGLVGRPLLAHAVGRDRDPGQPVRSDPVAPRGLRVPRLPDDLEPAPAPWRPLPLAARRAGVRYPVLQSVAVVYTGNHYVIDIAIGYAFAFAVFVATNRVWRRLGLPG